MSPNALAPYASRLTFHISRTSPTHPSILIVLIDCLWRRGWDSNPRSHCWDACFPSMSIRPLSHLSTAIFRGGILTCDLATGKVTEWHPSERRGTSSAIHLLMMFDELRPSLSSISGDHCSTREALIARNGLLSRVCTCYPRIIWSIQVQHSFGSESPRAFNVSS